MSYFVRRFLKCDSCGKTEEIDFGAGRLGLVGTAARGRVVDGWIDAGNDHHLCSACAKPYLAKKEEMERELKRLAGYDAAEMDL